MVWSLALRPDDAKQDPVVYGTKFGVVFLAEGPRTASIQEEGFGVTIQEAVLRDEVSNVKKTTTTKDFSLNPSLSYSSRQRNEFPWSQANPK